MRSTRNLLVLLAAMALAAAMIAPAAAQGQGQGSTVETEDVLDQMPGQVLEDGMFEEEEDAEREVYAEDAATLRRTSNGISYQVKMPTPEPGSYTYPAPSATANDEEGHPEAFTLWVFVFDDEQGPFGGNPWSSVYLGAGHVVGGPNLTLSGHISTETEPFAGFELENPRDVEVHLAVAPHGALDSERMPDQIKTPSGPGPFIWWVALFE